MTRSFLEGEVVKWPWYPLVLAHAKILALSFLGNLYEFFGDFLLSNICVPHSTTPWHEICLLHLSLVSLLSVLFLAVKCKCKCKIIYHITFFFLLGSPSSGRKTPQTRSSWHKSCPVTFLASHLTVEVQLTSAIAYSPYYNITGSSLKTLALKVFPNKTRH